MWLPEACLLVDAPTSTTHCQATPGPRGFLLKQSNGGLANRTQRRGQTASRPQTRRAIAVPHIVAILGVTLAPPQNAQMPHRYPCCVAGHDESL
jgi:hypothetical protein